MPESQIASKHHMITRAKAGIKKSINKLCLQATCASVIEPASYNEAKQHPSLGSSNARGV